MTGKSGRFCAYCYHATVVLIESYVIDVRADYEDVISHTTDRQRELLANEEN